MKQIFVLLIIVFILAACEKKEQQQTMPEQADSLNTEADSTKIAINENAPEWFNHLPSEDGFLYAVAEGRSIRANIAESKALLKARSKLAEKVEQLELSETEEHSAAGADDADGETDKHSVILEKSRIKHKKQIKVGKQWHVFILLEMPLNKNN